VILRFDNKPVASSSDLPRIVGSTKPGKQVPVEILRKGNSRVLNIVLGEMPVEQDEVVANAKMPAKTDANRLGLILRELTPQQKKNLNGRNGLLVVESRAPAAQAGIRRGDVILGLNNTEVQNLEQFNQQLAGIPSGKTVALLVLRSNNTLYVPVKVANGK
jgi:serine protease Do